VSIDKPSRQRIPRRSNPSLFLIPAMPGR
jgi:hypothetical protein